MRKVLFLLAVTAAMQASATEGPLWLRNAALSPDGNTLAFTYKGDIFTVPVTGGDARQITTNAGYDSYPVWSRDGSKIAFSSDREGSLDIYVMPSKGGTAKRLTTSSGKEVPRAFLDDSTLLFSTTLEGDQNAIVGPFQGQVYSVDIKGGRPRLYRGMSMPSISVFDDGRVAYQDQKGYEDVLRKHEHSSGTADIWVMDGNKYTKITSFNGQDQNPVWVDANTIAYISEQDGTMNVWRTTPDGKTKTQLTHFTKHPVRSLTCAKNGTIAFSWNGELYVMRGGEEPKKIDVNIVSDDYTGDLQKTIRQSGATDMSPSPDGKEVAFILRGDVYVTNVKYKTTKRITNTAAQERCVSFSPDGKSLVYDSERDGKWQLYIAKIKNSEEKQFAYASEIVEEPLYKGDKPSQQPAYSPDGKKVAFLYNRTELRVIDLASKKVTTALEGKYNYSYSDGDITYKWSPDSRWFLIDYIGIGGWNNSDIALVKADGTQVVNLTESGYTNSNPRWAMGGRAVTYTTSRYGMRSHGSWGEQQDVEVMVLDGTAWDELNRTEEEASLAKEEEKTKKDEKSDEKSDKKGKKDKGKKEGKADKKDEEVKPLEFDLDNRKFRVRRLTAISGVGDYWLDNDGAKIYYSAGSSEGGSNLMVRDLRKGETKVLVKGRVGGLEPDKKGENLFAIGREMCKIAVPDGKKENIEFEAPYDRHPSQEREYIYNHMLQQVRDKFYDANLHGVDWEMYGENYVRFLPHINNNYDFAELLSEILGELNASHTGGRYYASGAKMATANLGAFYDQNYDGDGLKVSEVINRGPLSDKKANVQVGDIIMAIDGEQILANADYYPLLEGKSGKPVRLTVKRVAGKTEDIVVRPIDSRTQSDLLYQRWVERNQAIVDSLSNGRVGYVHIEGMNSASYREVYSQLLGKYRNCDAVVVDTRWNGGGWLHNDIALLLSGKEYVRYSPQGQYIGSDPFSQWTKPSAMLVCEGNYSDAHGTPYVYQTLKIGDVIGAPVPGTMTAVWWETQIDPSLVFGIPQVTSLDRNGKPLENQQLNPDVVIYNNPADILRGQDDQLEGAVKHLLQRIK